MHVHQFQDRPNSTLLKLAVPVLFSLIAEPLTGLADTAFVARLGADPAAALGIGAMAYSAIFWVFSFLCIGTQTEVAQSLGNDDRERARRMSSMALIMAFGIALILMITMFPLLRHIAELFGGEGEVAFLAREYMAYRLLGAPAILVSYASFGALRGCEDMQTPLYVAVGVNGLNIVLDYLLVFGVGPISPMGVAGAAIASSISQWIGAIGCLYMVRRNVGMTKTVRAADARKLVSIGGDLFIRTASVLLFLGLTTRVANSAGAVSGAAHNAIRQFFIFAALFLDAYAIAGQSLIGYFIGKRQRAEARRVALYVVRWTMVTGVLMTAAMLFFEGVVAWALVPEEAHALFGSAWLPIALSMPVTALSFATDGIHWGTGDFRYLRNVMVVSCTVGCVLVLTIERLEMSPLLAWLWTASLVMFNMRTAFGLVRIWPGIGDAPLKG